MASSNAETVEARRAQSKASKQATVSKLLGKKRKTRELKITVDGDELVLKFQAISQQELDKLRAQHPPTAEQRAQNYSVNQVTFQPALVAACLIEPELTYEEAVEMWNSEHWSAGELNHLFDAASTICLDGLDIPLNANV